MGRIENVEKIRNDFFDFVKDMKDILEEIADIDETIKNYDETISHLNVRIPEDMEMKERLIKKQKEKIEKKPELIEKYKLLDGDFEVDDEDKQKRTINELLEGTLEGKRLETIQEINREKVEIKRELRENERETKKCQRELDVVMEDLSEFYDNYDNKGKSIFEIYKRKDELDEKLKDRKSNLEHINENLEMCDQIINEIEEFDKTKSLEDLITNDMKEDMIAVEVRKIFKKEEIKPELEPKIELKPTKEDAKLPKEDTKLPKKEIEQEPIKKVEPKVISRIPRKEIQDDDVKSYLDEDLDEDFEQEYEEENTLKMIYYNEEKGVYQFTYNNGKIEIIKPMSLLGRMEEKRELYSERKLNKGMKISRKTIRKADPNITSYLASNNMEDLEEYLSAIELKDFPSNFMIAYGLNEKIQGIKGMIKRVYSRLDARKAERANVATREKRPLLKGKQEVKEIAGNSNEDEKIKNNIRNNIKAIIDEKKAREDLNQKQSEKEETTRDEKV